MRLRDLSIRAKVLVTGLGALLFVLGIGALLSFRYWENEEYALTADNALMAVRALRPAIEGALAHGQVGWVREQLDSLVARPPARGYRIVAYDGRVMLSSQADEEGRLRPGVRLPDPWDIPPEGLSLRGRGESTASEVVSLSGVGGPGGRANLELVLDVSRIDDAIRRGRTFGLALTTLLGLAYAVVLGLMLEREIIAPVRQRRSNLARARAGEQNVRVDLAREDEVGRLSASVESLLAREQQTAQLAATRERELAEKSGFAEVGALAAQVGHEITRPLAGIKSAIELITQEYAMNDAEKALLSRVDDQLVQVDRTVRDLLSLARPVGLVAEPLRLRDVIDAALVRIAGTPGVDCVEIVRAYAEDEPQVDGDAGRLEQAFVNLLGNAVEAMPEGGTLTVCTRLVDGDVVADVADTGIGIPQQNLEQILKPFFSTKASGTGLGLPLVARIVAAHGGRLSVDSQLGKGSVFHVRLPVHVAGAVPGVKGDWWLANAS